MKNLSIIVPMHNVEKYAGKILQTLKAIERNDIDFIIVNDGSSDETENIIKTEIEKDDRFLYLATSQATGSPGTARNLALWRVRSKYIAFVDADDSFSTDVLISMLDKSLCENLDICASKFFYRVENGVEKLIANEVFEFCGDDVEGKIKNISSPYCSNIWNRIYKTELIKNNSILFPEYYISEDMCFSVASILCARSLKVVEFPLYRYTYNRVGSTTMNRVGEKGFGILKDIPSMGEYFYSLNLPKINEYMPYVKKRVASSVAYTYKRLRKDLKERFKFEFYAMNEANSFFDKKLNVLGE